MPKAAVGQTGFNTGEVSPLFYGSTDNPRYKKGLEVMENYIPTLQGPMIRRPGTKYVNNTKDATYPPTLIPFKFSATQNYMLEFGDGYIRFYTNNARVVTSGTTYKLFGGIISFGFMFFWATRGNTNPLPFETSISPTTISTGTPLEVGSPYSANGAAQLRWRQTGDTIYLFHPTLPTYKLQRLSSTDWKIQQVYFQDGPYQPINTYRTVGDSSGVTLVPLTTTLPNSDVIVDGGRTVTAMASSGGLIRVTTSAAHGFVTGQRVFIFSTVGTVEANNGSLYSGRTSSNATSWVITVISAAVFDCVGSVFSNAWISGGVVVPALFHDEYEATRNVTANPSQMRLLSLNITGARYWGYCIAWYDAATVQIRMGGLDISTQAPFPGTTTATSWRLGVWCPRNGYPTCGAFHQNRLVVAGATLYPQEVDGSMVGNYETFAPSVPGSLTIQDDNAFQFTLNSEDLNPIRWMESTSKGLVAATYISEWVMSPSGNNEALTPTNFSAEQSSFYGSDNVAAVKLGNAVMYIQRASRKLREMAYFFMQGTFKSTDITEISEHITLPALSQLEVQKENQPLIWGRRSDGALTSLVYNRDDASLSVGWSKHYLGGQSDSGGTIPVVLSFAFIPDPLVTFDQMWLVVKRYINGSTIYTIEYMTKISNDAIEQEDSFQLDCGATYDTPLTISGITIAATAVVTATSHGFSNGDYVKINSVVGLNKSTTDINGLVTVSNLVNGKTFVVTNKTTHTFELYDFQGAAVSSVGYSAWVSGGAARKLVTTITGLTWLDGETVSVLTDGGIHPDCVISGSGVLTLNYPAAKVQIGYKYKSKGKLLRAEAGAADGTSIGKTRRTTRAAMQLHRCGDISIGTSFDNLIAVELSQADQNQADNAVPLFNGIIREGLESAYDFESQLCFQQSSPLPGTIQSITTFMEETDI